MARVTATGMGVILTMPTMVITTAGVVMVGAVTGDMVAGMVGIGKSLKG
jgi:hypothetical protein